MLRGFYTAASGMLAQQRRAEMLSNNIANANTPGFKAEQGTVRAFPELLLSHIETNKNGHVTQKEIGPLHTGAYLQEIIPLYTQGDLKETKVKSDVALIEEVVPTLEETNVKGSLFYAVQTPEGQVKYTKNGHFSLDENGRLTLGGNFVLSTNGSPIVLTESDYAFSSDGRISVNGEPTGQQLDVRFASDVRNLVREGNGLYRTVGEEALPSAVGNGAIQYTLKQGYVETSNVDIASSYTDLLTAYRSFEANQKVLQAYDKSMDKAVNEIGRVR
ncbi:flagellar hook-basal body protein [Bacillus sp. FJAT-47783]|uniref:flagellar hook-basal body protein n=1 Tax=Bacillus sp. FJAT-47783 TaxID=2922712 RepID=UPI001FABA036|nr:flagellar hook-basal body protein [Bacillus sp. FJAT-47783]